MRRLPNTKVKRRCTKCFQWTSNFSEGSTSTWCRECRKKSATERRLAAGLVPTPVPKITKASKECLLCHRLRRFSSFGFSSRGRLRLRSYCKDCFASYIKSTPSRSKQKHYVASYRKKNRKKYLLLHRGHQMRRRAAKRKTDTGLVTKDFLKRLYAQKRCSYCKRYTLPVDRTADHVIPLSRGGQHHPNNLVMACGTCNSKKKDKPAQKFLEVLLRDRSKNHR